MAALLSPKSRQKLMKLITCQHEWVEVCTSRYRCDPPVGFWFEDAHYPLSEKLGGITTVRLWYPDHIVQGALQTIEYNYPCIDSRKKLKELEVLTQEYPEYIPLYLEAYKICQSYAASCTHVIKDSYGRSIRAIERLEKLHSEKDERGKSLAGLRNAERVHALIHSEKDQEGKSLHSKKCAQITNSIKNSEGKSAAASKAGLNTSAQRWEDPEHPELGRHMASTLVRMQKKRGYPHGPENRKRVY